MDLTETARIVKYNELQQHGAKIVTSQFLKDNFRNWTSGNSMIDNFIRHSTQINANENIMDYLEWIDFDQFELIENTNRRGAFSSIYSAIWMEGPR